MVIVKSFTNWDGMFKSDPVGLRNYIRIFSDPNFWTLLKNTGVFLLTIPVQALIGMIIAVILNDRIPGWRFFRLVYYLPSIISMTVVGLLYKIMFSYSGPLNEVLRAIGLDALAIEWLNSGPSARFVVFLCLVWSNIGWQVLIIFGGLTGIDPSILEAATIDGAGYWRRLFSITIPLLARTLEYSFVSAMIWIFTGIFPLIYSLSNGGPGYETTVSYTHLDVYKRQFQSHSATYHAAFPSGSGQGRVAFLPTPPASPAACLAAVRCGRLRSRAFPQRSGCLPPRCRPSRRRRRRHSG